MGEVAARILCRTPLASNTGATGEAFKDAMSRLAVGVVVAACWGADGAPVGLLVSSIAPVSAEPPRILFCVQKTARSHNALFAAQRISLNILSETDRAEAERFSSAERGLERFDPSEWYLDPQTPPQRRSALVSLTGGVGHRMDAGTHTVFILNVSDIDVRDAKPLVYFDRRYTSLRPLTDA
jgi:flavin reductase (DIM6/NTAB) family NADH-FMN oxidoreductase RutF